MGFFLFAIKEEMWMNSIILIFDFNVVEPLYFMKMISSHAHYILLIPPREFAGLNSQHKLHSSRKGNVKLTTNLQ
jgi:hypothetical protein